MLRSIFVASLSILFSVGFCFLITWGCISIQSAFSTPPLPPPPPPPPPPPSFGGKVASGLSSTFNGLTNGFSSLTNKISNGLSGLSPFGDSQEPGIHSAKVMGASYFAENRFRKLIIDTDGSVDDAIAIFMILSERSRPIQVIAITTVVGHTDVKNATKNILRTLKVLNKDRDIPIYMGTSVGILKYPQSRNGREYYFGYDGHGENGYEGPSVDELPKYHAVLAIIDAVKNYPGEVTIFCTGPLTNIALAIRIYPEFVRDVKQIYILGGSVYRLDTTNPIEEFNFQQDPEALKIVFDERIKLKHKIFFVNWENVSNLNIPLDWRVNVLGKLESRKIALINKIEWNSLKVMSDNKRKLWICPGAVLAAMYLKPYKIPMRSRITLLRYDFSKNSVSNTANTNNAFGVLPRLSDEDYKNILLNYLK